MAQKYLIAIDNSETADRIINYIKEILRIEDRVMLYSVIPAPVPACDLNDPSLVPIFTQNRDLFCSVEEARKEDMKKVMEKAAAALIDSGFSRDKIKTKIESEKKGIALHIVDEASEGNYNSIVIGKHNSSRLSEILLGSITNKVIHLSKDTPVIAV